jgi:hypothetical protein
VQRVKRPTTTSHQVGTGLAPPVRADERKHTIDKGECTVKKNQRPPGLAQARGMQDTERNRGDAGHVGC